MKRNIRELEADRANDNARYLVTEKNKQPFEVRFSLTGKACAKPSPEAKISKRLDRNSARTGTVLIPDYHFQEF
jgi:hypothetical protein